MVLSQIRSLPFFFNGVYFWRQNDVIVSPNLTTKLWIFFWCILMIDEDLILFNILFLNIHKIELSKINWAEGSYVRINQ